jgi:hypothetical protein
MEIKNLPSGGRVRTLSVGELSKRERDTLQGVEADKAHNVYVAPCLAPLLEKQGFAVPPIHYGLSSTRIVYYAAKAPVSDKGLLGDKGKHVLDLIDLGTSSGAADIVKMLRPDVAGYMPEMNIFVGVVGCIDKLSYTGLQKRVGGGFCFADMVVKTLLLLGQFIPGLQHIASHLMVVQFVIKGGDKIAELAFSLKQKPGQDVLKAVEVNVSNFDVVQLPGAALRKALVESAGLTPRTEETPPA